MNELNFTLADVKTAVEKWLYLEDTAMLDVVAAGFVANQFQSDPTWIMFLGPPSSAKTEILRMLDGHDKVYFLSNLTPATLLSGKSEKQASLLFQLNDKILVLKDFGTILTMRSESQHEILSQLREVYDQQYSKGYGARSAIHWTGHVGLLAAATPVFDRCYGVNNALGDRFLIFRTRNSNDDDVGAKAQEVLGREVEMRQELRAAMHTFVNQFLPERLKEVTVNINSDFKRQLRLLVSFCAKARCHVQRNYRSREVEHLPEPEGPGRLIKQLTQMAVALTLVHGKTEMDETVYGLIARIGKDIIPPLRLKMLKSLYSERLTSTSWFSTREAGESSGVPTATARFILEELMMVGLVKSKRQSDSETAPNEWQLSEQVQENLEITKIFNER